MAVVVKNTFLDVAEYKFLHFDEPSCISRRSKSVPQQWKPSMPCATSVEANHVISGSQPCLFNTVSTDSLESTDASPSLFSAKDGSPSCKVCLQSALSSRNSRYYADAESEINAQEHSDSTIAPEEADAAYSWNCPTPTSSIDCPRDLPHDWSEDLTHGNLTPADAQRQLDEMSQKVMDIWAKLRAIESSVESKSEDTQCRSTPIVEKQAADLADNSEETVAPGSGDCYLEVERVLGYLTNPEFEMDAGRNQKMTQMTSCQESNGFCARLCLEAVSAACARQQKESDYKADACAEKKCAAAPEIGTRLRSNATTFRPAPTRTFQPAQPVLQPAPAPTFQPAPNDTRSDAVVNAINLALQSCGALHNIMVQKAAKQASTRIISAEVQSGPHAASRSYNAIQLVKQALESISEHVDTISLLSARVQQEDGAYSLRSNIAILPVGAEDQMCWDMFRQGHCQHRSQCRWYHPQDADLSRIKVFVKYSEYPEDVFEVFSEMEVETKSSYTKHKLFLDDLL